MDNSTVCVVALDKGTGFIKTVTSCNKQDAQKYAKHYRNIGYNARVLHYDKLYEMQTEELKLRRCNFVENNI